MLQSKSFAHFFTKRAYTIKKYMQNEKPVYERFYYVDRSVSAFLRFGILLCFQNQCFPVSILQIGNPTREIDFAVA